MRRHRFPLLLLVGIVAIAVIAAGTNESSAPVDMNSAKTKEIAALPGMTTKLAEAIVAWRAEHGPFPDPAAVRKVPGMTDEIWQGIEDRVRTLPPLDGKDPLAPPPGQDVGLIAIANYFIEFEGLDLSVLPDDARQAFLDTVNTELCDCGCAGDTMARCYVNDPGCPVARKRVKQIYDFVLEHSTKTAPEAAHTP